MNTNQIQPSTYLSAMEVGRILGVSKAYAYRIIKQLNEELTEKGYITISGKVSKLYFSERLYGGLEKNE